MRFQSNNWVLLLAAGGGDALEYLITDGNGRVIPRQFCSLNGGESLLQESLRRARKLAPYRRVCVVVDAEHEHYWRPMLMALPEINVIVQLCNRGSLNALLLGVVAILTRDAQARVFTWSADHHVLDEETLVRAVRCAGTAHRRDREILLGDRVLLLGMVPDDIDHPLRYIIPGVPVSPGIREVARFADNPTAVVARDLAARGALCNSLILAANAASIVECIRERFPEIVDGFVAFVGRDTLPARLSGHLQRSYENLPVRDVTQLVSQGGETAFCVFVAPACGWTDLATPRRVSNALHRLWSSPHRSSVVGERRAPGVLSLASHRAALHIPRN